MAIEKAMFGAGCFWGVEAAFARVGGVVTTAVGYAGGDTPSPTYEQVCTDRTGHAEVVLVEFDTDKTTYQRMLDVFWQCHDPTQLNRQGPDVGTQYRSVIFYFDDAQRLAAEQSRTRLAKRGGHAAPIVTVIEQAPAFHRAEAYHQRYLEKRGRSSCSIRPASSS